MAQRRNRCGNQDVLVKYTFQALFVSFSKLLGAYKRLEAFPPIQYVILLLLGSYREDNRMEITHTTQIWRLAAAFQVFLAITTLVREYFGNKERRKPHYPSGPRSLPILGSVVWLMILRKNPAQTLRQTASKYGALCMLWLGSTPVMIVRSPKAAKDLLDKAGG